jgi:hypothetical protein
MSDKVKPWKGRKPSKKNKPLRISNEKIVSLHADDDGYQEDRFPRDDFDDTNYEDEFPQ